MPRVLDVIEYPDVEGNELVRRVPEVGAGDIRLGSQLIVREGQTAIFFRSGKALDVFRPGRYTLTTANIPLLVNAIGMVFSGRSPFTAEVYFVNTRRLIDMKWGTPQAVTLRDRELGLVRLRAFGTYSMQIIGPRMFVGTVAGARGLYQTTDIEDFLRGIIVSRLTDLMGTSLTTLLDLPANFDELSAALKAKVKSDFSNLGIEMGTMYIEAITPTEDVQKALDERAAMGAVGNLQAYLQFKAAQALGDAAHQEGEGGPGLAGTGVGLVAGLGLGGALASAMGRALAGPSAQDSESPPLLPPHASALACPSCHAENPADANFCLRCGAKLETLTRCQACQAELPAGAQFCSRCGAKVEEST
ncbi:MAG: SPFH domain-containing protein [Chloroflexi bacterium]|nr:SPFH domain-containing protein [Chloroflexota bacterium]